MSGRRTWSPGTVRAGPISSSEHRKWRQWPLRPMRKSNPRLLGSPWNTRLMVGRLLFTICDKPVPRNRRLVRVGAAAVTLWSIERAGRVPS